MSKFNVGDLVKRTGNTLPQLRVLIGELYTVTGNVTDGIELKEVKGIYDSDNFTLVTYLNKPHVHKDLIIAWANGAEIEYLCNSHNNWYLCDPKPAWNPTSTYRIKPQKSDKEIQLEKLEQKARELADEIKALRSKSCTNKT